jgi:hypothetical protein
MITHTHTTTLPHTNTHYEWYALFAFSNPSLFFVSFEKKFFLFSSLAGRSCGWCRDRIIRGKSHVPGRGATPAAEMGTENVQWIPFQGKGGRPERERDLCVITPCLPVYVCVLIVSFSRITDITSTTSTYYLLSTILLCLLYISRRLLFYKSKRNK